MDLLIIVALVLVNGLFAGAEIAIVAVRRSRLAELVREGDRAARAVQRLKDDPERFFATVQVGITVIGATAAAFGGATLAGHMEPHLRGLPVIGPYAAEAALALVIALVSFLSLVLGELVPKSLALRVHPGRQPGPGPGPSRGGGLLHHRRALPRPGGPGPRPGGAPGGPRGHRHRGHRSHPTPRPGGQGLPEAGLERSGWWTRNRNCSGGAHAPPGRPE